MATYTDLHNRVKENITVSYNDRITPQEVHFLNQNNEYWGTLKGHISAENIHVNGGTLDGVTLKNVTFADGQVNFPGGIDYSQITTNVIELSTDLANTKEIADSKYITYEEQFKSNDSAHKNYDINIEQLSDFVKKLNDNKLDKDSAAQSFNSVSDDLVDYINESSVNLSTYIENVSADITKKLNINDSNLCTEISALDKKVIELNNHAIENDNFLSNEITALTFKFGGEVFDRTLADNKLCSYIENNAIASVERDNNLSNEINSLRNETANNILDLKDITFEKIEHDKHYTLSYNLEDTYPFGCKDFAVNVYKPTVKSGIVEYNENGKKYIIGEISKISNGYVFKTYSNIESNAILSAINANYLYEFTDGIKTVNSGKENSYYQLTLDSLNTNIKLQPLIPNYNALKYGSVQVGKVFSAEKDGDNILSGILYFDTTDSGLVAFNKFKNISFNTTDLSTKTIESERFEYHGNNNFVFVKNVNKSDYIPLKDEKTNIEFARIYKDDNEESFATSIVTKIIDGNKTAKLEAINGYKSIVESNETVDLTLSANIVENEAIFDLVEVSELYKYGFNGANAEGETIELGYIVPNQYNKIIAQNAYFDELSVDLTNVVNIDAFKRIVVLTKNDVLWDCEVVENENVLNVKFNGKELSIKVTSKDGEVRAYRYNVNVDSPEIFNIADCHKHLYVSQKTELKYTESIETLGDQYNMNIDEVETHDQMATYTLDISTEQNEIMKIAIPKKSFNDISREFSILIKPIHTANTLIELQLTNISGEKIDFVSNRRNKLFIPTNKWTNLQVHEISNDKFFIKDFDGNENAFEIKTLSNNLENLSTVVGENIASITDIYSRIKGGINYKGTVYGSFVDSGEHITPVNSISVMLLESIETYTADTQLSNGFMYIVQQLPNDEAKKFIIEEKDIEVGDQIIINCKGVDGKAIKDLTINDVDIIDNEDYDTVHQPEFIKLSNDLSGEIDSLSTALSIEISCMSSAITLSVANICTDINSLSNRLSTEIDSLSNRLSNEVIDLSIALSTDINSLSDRLSVEINLLSNRLSTDVSCMSSAIALSVDGMHTNITNISTDLLSIDTRYANTFISSEYEHVSSDNLILTEIEHPIDSTETEHKRYRMVFESGTIVLKPLN